MAYEFNPFDATLSAAAGDDPVLQAELRTAFMSSARRQVDLLRRSRCDANWHMAALRLKTIAASFHAEELLALAEAALVAAPGEPAVIRLMEEHFDSLERGGRN